MIDLFIAFVSLSTAATIIALLRRDRFVRACVALVYGVWHLPVIIPIVTPVLFDLRSTVSLSNRYLPLVLLHLIMLPAVLLRRGRRARAAIALGEPEAVDRCGGMILAVAVFGAIALVVDTLLFRGALTVSDLGARRVMFSTSPPTILGQLGILAAGAALLLVVSNRRAGSTLLQLAPFGVIAALFLYVGNRQFLVLGCALGVMRFIRDVRPRWRTLVVALTALGLTATLLAVAYGAARQREAEGAQDAMLSGMLNLTLIEHNRLGASYLGRTVLLYTYAYFGIEYDVAAHVMTRLTVRAPVTSLTAPLLYRRGAGFMNTRSELAITNEVNEQLRATAGIYPNVWYTMFGQVFLEGGLPGVWLVTAVLTIVHGFLAVAYRPGRTSAGLIVFYALVAFGVMFAPTREGFVIGLLLTLVLASSYASLILDRRSGAS